MVKHYTIKQIEYYQRISKSPTKKLIWQNRKNKEIKRLKRNYEKLQKRKQLIYHPKAMKRLSRREKLMEIHARRQGIQLEKEQEIQRREEQAKRKLQKIEQKINKRKPLIDYLKPNTISETTTSYDRFQTDIPKIYDELLNKAMTNPKEFKQGLIEQIDKLRNMFEVHMEFTGALPTKKGNEIVKQGQITIYGKTLDEIKQKMMEFGIVKGEILDSDQFKNFAEALETSVYNLQTPDATIREINIKIRLMRGK